MRVSWRAAIVLVTSSPAGVQLLGPEDHFSLAFTYAWMAATVDATLLAWLMSLKDAGPRHPRDNPAFTASFFEDTRTHHGREIKPLLGPSGFW